MLNVNVMFDPGWEFLDPNALPASHQGELSYHPAGYNDSSILNAEQSYNQNGIATARTGVQ